MARERTRPTHFTAELVARLGVTGAQAEQLIGLPICPVNDDTHWEAQTRWLHQEGRRAEAFGAFCRISSPARQKRLAKSLWGMRHAGEH